MKLTAEISACGTFRWWLQRRWGEGPTASFVMLNPSTADAEKDDPTIRKCIAFATSWGFNALDVRNLYPFRATDPKELLRAMRWKDVCGGERGDNELRAVKSGGLIVAAWGANATKNRVERFLSLTDPSPVWCIAISAKGNPVHPLYQKITAAPVPFRRCEAIKREAVVLDQNKK